MGIVTNYHNSIELLTNVSVTNPFDSKLQGWRSVEDALIFSNADLKIPDHAKWIIDYKDNPDTFNINSDFFRSDEFKIAHDGKHILFSGCSVTYGVGLYTKELWSHLLYNKIKNKEKVSGYYNLGTPGTGVFDIVFNIFKYIKNYGNPDVIFIDLPDLSRFYALINSSDQWVDTIPNNSLDYIKRNYRHANYKNQIDNQAIIYEKRIYIYQYLHMLETYCRSNNIKLYLFSYVDEVSRFINITDLQRYYHLDSNMILSSVYEYHNNNPKDDFYLIARDNSHPGTGLHYAWSELVFNIYKAENYVN
jgi:hypothetical protein